MQISLGNYVVRTLLSIGGFVLLLGGLLDTFSNAISIITPTLTYVLTGVVLAGTALILILEKKAVLNITYNNGSPFSVSDLAPLTVIAALLIVIWLPRLVPSAPANTLSITTQRGVLELQGTKTYEVFYPRPFANVPNLTFSKKVDNQYFGSSYEVMEQRRDGFKINFTVTSNPGAIEWWAEGVIDTNASPNK